MRSSLESSQQMGSTERPEVEQDIQGCVAVPGVLSHTSVPPDHPCEQPWLSSYSPPGLPPCLQSPIGSLGCPMSLNSSI